MRPRARQERDILSAVVVDGGSSAIADDILDHQDPSFFNCIYFASRPRVCATFQPLDGLHHAIAEKVLKSTKENDQDVTEFLWQSAPGSDLHVMKRLD